LDLADRVTAFGVAFLPLCAGCGLGTGRFLAARVFFLAAARLFGGETAAAFFAFLAGALPVAERLVIGFRRTDLPANVRLLLVDVED